MVKADILKTLESIKDEVRQKYKAEIKGIFGSYSRDEAKKDSDLDVLVDFLEGATLFDLAALGDYLEQKLHCKVDVVSQRALREEIKPFVYEYLTTI